jgi:hypothetical protein
MRGAALAAALCAAVVIVCVAPRLDAEAVKCLKNDPCQPPPCELLYELKVAKANLRGWKVGSFGGADVADLDQVQRLMRTKNRETQKAYAKYARCPRSFFYQSPDAEVTSWGDQCEIEYAPGKKDFAQYRSSVNSCIEVVNAEAALAQQWQAYCVSSREYEGKPVPLDYIVLMKQSMYQAKVDVLENALLQYMSSCAPDATTSKRISQLGLDTLKKTGAENRRAWKRAKRAAARGR